MIISLIAAVDSQGLIGDKGNLPWKLPADTKWFHEKIKDKPLIMGRNTYESLKASFPFSDNIILTHRRGYIAPKCYVADCVVDAVNYANYFNNIRKEHCNYDASSDEWDEIMVIGGAQVYEIFLPLVDKMYITMIHGTFEGDTYFPDFNEKDWKRIKSSGHEKDDNNLYSMTFNVYERIKKH